VYEIGDTLREARLRRGMTIKDVEDATKIRSKYLQALESDDFEVIPGPTFVIAFLRTYGEFMGLDTVPLLDEYRSRFQPSREPHAFPVRPVSSRPKQQSSRRRSPASSQRNHIAIGVIAVIIVVVLAWVGWGNRERTATIEPATTTTTTGLGSITSTALGDGSGSTTATGPTDTTTPTTGKTGSTTTVDLTVKATGGRCYLLVRDGSATGRQLYAGTLAKGESGHYTSESGLFVNVGQPAALQVTLNGKGAAFSGDFGDYMVTASGIERVQ
jgi:cytoskeleton protein RodZ